MFHRFVFLRDDFGLQLRLGNGAYADGMLMAYLQPNLNKLELQKFQSLGELEYADLQTPGSRLDPGTSRALCGDQPQAHLLLLERSTQRNPDQPGAGRLRTSAFLATSVLAIWGAIAPCAMNGLERGFCGACMIFYPAIYYFVYPHARYRHPIEPEL